MGDKLVAVSHQDLVALRDLYKVEWPRNHVGYYALNNYLEWLNQDPDIPHLEIYSLNGDWTDGTFILIDRNMLLLNTLNTDKGRLITALSLIDFSRGYLVSSFIQGVYSTVWDFVKSRGLDYRYYDPTKYYCLPRSEASKLTVEFPEGISLKRLSPENAVMANELWGFKYPGSETFLPRIAKYNDSIGAFTADGELIGWCFRLPIGAIGALQVKDPHKRKGLGSLLVKAMAKKISDMDQDVFAPVVVDNYPSQNMFEKLGFQVVDNMHWLGVTSSIFAEWRD